MRHSALALGILLAFAGAALAGADYVFKERPHERTLEQANGSGIVTPTDTVPPSSSSSSMFVKKGVSTKKKNGADIPTLLAALQFMPTDTSEASVLALTIAGAKPTTKVLLLNNDRAALFSWIENDEVKSLFSELKRALQEQFSPKLQDLVDMTETPDTGPPVDILSFTDPAIASEKVIFLRVRNRLFELHVVVKSEEAVQRLMEELKK